MKALNTILSDLTYDDIDLWAGERIRVRGKAYIGRVDSLHRTAKGELVAWVSGTEDYATLVHLDEEGAHEWFCTCPYDGGPCKHAVAVILAAAQQVKHKRDIPLLSEDDDLHLVLFTGQEEEVIGEDPDAAGDGPDGKREKSKLHKLLAAKSREELLELVLQLVANFPAVERAVAEAEQLKSGRIEPLVHSLRREICTLTSEPAWSSPWSDEQDVPDYSHVRQQFATMLATGHADILLELGDELWRRGSEQVEQSDDEGETGEAIAQCLDIVLRALAHSSLPPGKQLLWVIDRLMEDEYGLLHTGEKMLEDPMYGPEAWREVAVALEARMVAKAPAKGATPVSSSSRAAILDRLIVAYRQSGWPEKIIPLMEQEVERLGNYGQLVDMLIEAGDLDKAWRWCCHGFSRTVKETTRTAEGLQERLRGIAEIRQQQDLVAAHRALEFFRKPDLRAYKDLRAATEPLGCWPAVRAGVLAYLETGRRPEIAVKKKEPAAWPLPEPEVSYPLDRQRSGFGDGFRAHHTLIDIAIDEKRFDDVVALYQTMKKSTHGAAGVDQTVAKAVAKTHPDVALAIWRQHVDRLIAEVKPRAYIEAGAYLRMMHKVFKANQRQVEWEGLLVDLRRTHKAKRRLLEVLDSLSGAAKKIIG